MDRFGEPQDVARRKSVAPRFFLCVVFVNTTLKLFTIFM